MSKNLILRIAVALIFGPLIIYFSYKGGYWLSGMILFFALLGIGEYVRGNKFEPAALQYLLGFLAVGGSIILAVQYSFIYSFAVFIGYFLLNGIVHAVQSKTPLDLYHSHIKAVWGVAYVGLLWPFVYYIRILSPDLGGHWLLFLLGTLWLSDSLAMFGGKAFGKRKLAPTVSPNKTIAGFVCGLSGGIIVAMILYFWLLHSIQVYHLIFAGIAISLIGQLGDLVESMWKRAIGIKDSSSIIPGHGGILDRFDSLLFSAPVLYLYLILFIYR